MLLVCILLPVACLWQGCDILFCDPLDGCNPSSFRVADSDDSDDDLPVRVDDPEELRRNLQEILKRIQKAMNEDKARRTPEEPELSIDSTRLRKDRRADLTRGFKELMKLADSDSPTTTEEDQDSPRYPSRPGRSRSSPIPIKGYEPEVSEESPLYDFGNSVFFRNFGLYKEESSTTEAPFELESEGSDDHDTKDGYSTDEIDLGI
jgi:hypothetical protein